VCATETIHHRALNLDSEQWIVNDIKERVCYVSQDMPREVERARQSRRALQSLAREYVLPNGTSLMQGYVRTAGSPPLPSSLQSLQLTTERFSVPELLFTPTDAGLPHIGLAEACMRAVQQCPMWMQNALLAHVVISGGCARLDGLSKRLTKELRALAPSDALVHVTSLTESGHRHEHHTRADADGVVIRIIAHSYLPLRVLGVPMCGVWCVRVAPQSGDGAGLRRLVAAVGESIARSRLSCCTCT
jgi:actin-related protein 6